MPYVTITATKGLSADQKKQLLQRSSDTVAQSLNAKLAAVRVVLHELPDAHYSSGGQFGVPTVMYEIDMIAGRSEEQKASVIAELAKTAHEVTGVPLAEIRTRLTDFPNTNMGMGNGVTAKQAGR